MVLSSKDIAAVVTRKTRVTHARERATQANPSQYTGPSYRQGRPLRALALRQQSPSQAETTVFKIVRINNPVALLEGTRNRRSLAEAPLPSVRAAPAANQPKRCRQL